MGNKEALQLFGEKRIRTAWNQEEEKWYFSIVDVCEELTDSKDYLTARKYWNKLKQRLVEEGNETVTNCHQLKLRAVDGKMRQTDVADQQQLFRLIQSIPSPKAEPFKQWIAKVASERIDEIQDPELAIMRAAEYYRARGYSEGWINQRLQSIRMRKELTDEWKARGIQKEKEYAILTNEMTVAWSGLTVREYKDLKGLKKESLRDNMTDIELVLNMLAEVSTKAISQARQPDSFSESKQIAREGGSIAGDARENIEKRVGGTVISALNAKDKPALDTGTQAPEIQ
ncbi:MAG: Bro-N domain-containing protein [Bacteroidales bacterium]|nr:Bro-N domain-containing protein [Bacteroidales bacterium]